MRADMISSLGLRVHVVCAQQHNKTEHEQETRRHNQVLIESHL